ncbi:RagB/SusD family nutrient uptake outer membrane protein [termite gut metagenome]|uniref:RagB/SusD family nutrient uptake outer membrane protein n=1 Tax=termite gut metagenome TaxID=433724 RepID=A0A5J4RF92_9ZZZZ
MKILKYIFICGLIVMPFSSCQDFLDVNPKATLSDDQLNSTDNVEKMVIAAYSLLENDNRNQSPVWYNGMRGGDAYKGGGGTSDMSFAYDLEVAATIKVNSEDYENKWVRTYVAISRANNVLSRIQNLEVADYPLKEQRAAEMRFLRAHHHFQIKELFKHIVWMDETIPQEEVIEQSNRKYTDQELWEKIADDFREAARVLPDPDKTDIGRANKYSAKAYLAKTLLFAAYIQDDQHNVISIDKEKLNEVVQLVDEIINSGYYKLNEDFAYNFLYDYENSRESILAIQSSNDDGTPYGRLNQYGMLSYPHSKEYGCCGMHLPSQSIVNAFKTDPVTGFPLFDTYQDDKIITGSDLEKPNRTVDPRLMHTVGILGRPYKYMPDYLVNSSFIRDSLQYGPFVSMKETEKFTCSCVTTARWFPGSSLNRDIIRYDEILLWKAEALIQLDREKEALPIINTIRSRAANSTEQLVMIDPRDSQTKPSANFHVKPYTDATWTKEFAWQALQWERRLEFAMESRRGEDLVRWGIAAEELNKYYEIEQKHRTTSFYNTAKFTKNKHEYLPIPSKQISFSRGLYVQNYGYETL